MHRYFWNLVAGEAINVFGDTFGTLAMGWLVYELTGSKLAMGGILIAGMIPDTVMKLLASPLIDRYSRSRLMAGMDLFQFMIYAAIPLLHLMGWLQVWHLYALSILAGIARALYIPTMRTLLPALASPDQAFRANSILTGATQGAQMVGPIVAGIVVVQWGSYLTLGVDAITFGLCGAALLLIPRAFGQPPAMGERRAGYLAQMAEGFQFFRKAPALLILLILAAALNMGALAITGMMVPFVKENLHAGAQALGLITGSGSIGLLLGTIAAGSINSLKQRRIVVLSGATLWGLGEIGMRFAGEGQVALIIALMVLIGFAIGVNSIFLAAIYQIMTPDRIRGRVMAVRTLVAWSANPLGAFLGAAMAQAWGIPTMILVVGTFSTLVALSAFFIPALKQIDGDLHPIEAA